MRSFLQQALQIRISDRVSSEMHIKKEEKGHLTSSLEYSQLIAQERLCLTWNAIWKADSFFSFYPAEWHLCSAEW